LLGVVSKKQNAEGWVVINDDAAETVEHRPAWSNDRNGPNSIALRQLRITVGIDDLQLPETEKQQGHEPYNRIGNNRQPRLRQAVFILKPEGQTNSAPAARTALLSLLL